MRFIVDDVAGLDPQLVIVLRQRLTLGLARFAGRISRVALSCADAHTGLAPRRWVVRVISRGRAIVVVEHPDPIGDATAVAHLAERVVRTVARTIDAKGAL